MPGIGGPNMLRVNKKGKVGDVETGNGGGAWWEEW